MKNNTKTGKLVSMLLLVTMILLVLLSGTYAKYTSQASGSDTATIAKWKINVNDNDIAQTTSVTFDLFNTIYDTDGTDEENVKENYIAPGTKGSFDLRVKNDSDVDAEFTIELETNDAGLNIPIQYSSDGTNWKSVDETSKKVILTTKTLDQNSEEETINVQWRWSFDGDHTEIGKAVAQIGEGETQKALNITATMTATQVD